MQKIFFCLKVRSYSQISFIFVETKGNKMRKNVKSALELHEKAVQLLKLYKDAERKVENFIEFNRTIALPSGFITPHTEAKIDFQKQVARRVWRSYAVVVNQLNSQL